MWRARRIAIFLLALALLVPLLFWLWTGAQPLYSGLITRLADAALGVEEWGTRVTRLRLAESGDVIQVLTPLREDGQPANTYDARVLHFYVVPTLAVVLAFPGLGLRRRALALGVTAALVILFQVLALVVTVEHTYAVTLTEIARRNYTPADQAVYTWLVEAFAFLGVQTVPATALVVLAALHGPLGTRARDPEDPPPPGEAGRAETGKEGAPGLRRAVRMAAVVGLVIAGTGLVAGGMRHRAKIHARQAETLCVWGQWALAKDDITRAESFFSQSIRLEPGFAYAHAGLARCLTRRGDAAGAIRSWQEAIGLDPSSVSWHMEMARLQIGAGLLDEAERTLRGAIEQWPGEPALRLNLSIMLSRAQRLCEAIPHLEAFLDLAPHDRDAAQIGQALAQAREQCGPR